MHIDAQTFLLEYAEALDTRDVDRLTGFCLLPTVVMNDQQKILFNNQAQLTEACETMMQRMAQAKVVKNTPKLSQAIRLSDTLYFIKMRWLFLDKSDTLLFSCPTSYTLQRVGDNGFKIIVAVVDPDENAMLQLFSIAKD